LGFGHLWYRENLHMQKVRNTPHHGRANSSAVQAGGDIGIGCLKTGAGAGRVVFAVEQFMGEAQRIPFDTAFSLVADGELRALYLF
jgi:hypothetical protein